MIKASGKNLLIVESPAKAKTIAKYLDHRYRVLASVGHIRDLPKSNKNAIDIAAGFVPHYEIVKGKERIVSELRQAAKEADQVLLATDPDREGEAIAWHIAQAIGLKNEKRIVFHEVTKEAIEEALRHPRSLDNNLRLAQEARRVLDRLFGYDLSGLIWQKLRYGLSAGRVQSPALRILVEREKEIRAFVPVKFWVLEAILVTRIGEEINFIAAEEPTTAARADAVVAAGREAVWQVDKVEESKMNRRPRPPFTTSTLQQAASSRLGLSPAQTMRLAQRLYEEGCITYMRTDSTNLNRQAIEAIIALAKSQFGSDYAADARVYQVKSKNAQEAHEAIRPTDILKRQAGRNPAEEKLYNLIWRRTIASQMTDASVLKTKITAVANSATVPPFAANGYQVVFAGWLAADPHARGEDIELPRVASGDPLALKKMTSAGRETLPPHRYSEAGLVKELEKRGIGRPSTYASIIKTLHDRGYAEKVARSLIPTETGEVVSNFLSEHFQNYISDSFTAKMEDELDDIAAGRLGYVTSLKNFYEPFAKAVASKKTIPKITNLGAGPVELKCPACGAAMIWKLGRAGRFLSCERFPTCLGARSAEGKTMEGPKLTGEHCPECKTGELVEREGRYGKFVACANYPKCKYIKKDALIDGEKPGDTGVTCSICQTGTMVEKRGRYGVFYGCSNYPKCKHIIKSKPTGALCPTCGSLMMQGTKTIPDRCSDKTCPNHNPHKLKS